MDATTAVAEPPADAGPERTQPPTMFGGLAIQLDRIRRHLPLVAAIVVLAAIAAGAVAVTSRSNFTAQAVLSVASKTRSPTDDAALAQGYVLFFNESNYREQLAERAHVDDGVSAFDAQTAGLSPVFYVTATSSSRDTAQHAASAMAQTFASEINGRLAAQRDAQIADMNDNFQKAYRDRTDPEALAAQTQLQKQIDELNGDSANQVTVLEPSAGVTEEGSGALETSAMLLMGGVLLGCAAAIGAGIASRRLETDYDVAEKLGVPPLDVLPAVSDDVLAASRAVRVQHVLNAIVRGQGAGPASLTVAGASDGGCADDLATALAEQRAAQGVRTVLVDANVRSGDSGEPGLAQLLGPDAPPLDDVLERRSETLHVVGPGSHVGDPFQLFDRDRFVRLLDGLHARADFVVVSAPALARAAEAQTIGDVTGGVLLVLEAGTRLDEAREAIRVLDQVGATLLGTVLVERAKRARRPAKSTAG